MKTKKTNKFSCLIMVVVIAACNSFLEEPEPAQTLPSETVFHTAKDVQNGLIGAYSAIKQGGLFGCNIILCSDILADNGEYRGTWMPFTEMYNHAMTSLNAESGAIWQQGYKAINQANLVLQAIETIDDTLLTEDLAKQLRGEALFIRAVTHFELVRYFGLPYGPTTLDNLGVPIMTQATDSPDNITFPSRNTVKEVYDSVIADLMEADSIIPDKTVEGHANRYTTLAYLARIYFQMQDYAHAADYAQQVIKGTYKLNPSPEDIFVTEGTDEEIWPVKETTQDNPGRNASLAAHHKFIIVSHDLDSNGFHKIITDSQAAAIMQDSLTVVDLRDALLIKRSSSSVTNKYEDYGSNADDAPILRLAEFILIRAEALARLNLNEINQESIDLLNEIRVRSIRVMMKDGNPAPNNGADYIRYKVSDFETSHSLIEAIILERRVELCFEGNRFHDLCRLQLDVHGKKYSDPFLRFPIPQREMDANPHLQQNPGY